MSVAEKRSTGRDQILSNIPPTTQKEIDTLFKKVDKNKEFEFIFFSKKSQQVSQKTENEPQQQVVVQNMNKEKYVLLLKYIRAISKAKKLRVTGPDRSLDVSYNASPEKTYRIGIDGAYEINKNINRLSSVQNKNYVIYKFLLQMINKRRGDDKSYSFMLKSKEEGNTVDIDDLSMRVRLSGEDDIIGSLKKNTGKIDSNLIKLLTGEKIDLDLRKEMNKRINFRLKERTSLYIEEDDDHFIRIDLTDTKTTSDLQKINSTYSNYELEIEYGVTDSKKVKSDHLMAMYSTSETLLKLVQQSSFLIGNQKSQEVIEFYKDMIGVTDHINSLVSRQAVSLEIQHVTEILPDRYTVTDKADGDRYFLIIYKNSVYLISYNLNVKDTGIVLDKKLKEFNGSILDGEYIYLPSERRHLFMAFDCLRNGEKDVRSTISLKQRLDEADDIVEKCFIFKGQTGFTFKEPPAQKDEFNLGEVSKFYNQELAKYYDVLNKDIQQAKLYPLIRRKFFMPVLGAKRWELFDYSVKYWSSYTEDANVKFPYFLDGLIYHPLEQSYNTNAAESKYHEYKWKPPTKNSIDFYIEFKRDPQTGKIIDVYDNSNLGEEDVRNRTYKICTLFVGKSIRNKEQPVPFDQNYGISEAYIYERDGEIRDMSGDIISDKTVVEFYYNNDPLVIPQRRWIPIKTRYDKTESVERYGRRYGNYLGTAERIWRSIINPVLMDDFVELARGNTAKRNFFDIKIKEMNAKISHQLIVAVNRENKYYQKQTRLASTMRQYHNFIKSNLIYTFCNMMYQSNTQQSVLDIACGRGGDIGKFYYTEVAYYVGIDIDAEGFKSPVDGAISRYNRFKKKKPNFPKMYFIQADARALLEYDAQLKALSGMDEINKKLLQKFFPTKGPKSVFDRINCQFAMHYFLKDEISWTNFKANLKNHLRAGGYYIATTFDAQQVINSIGTGDAFTVYNDESDGTKKIFFEILKKYEDPVEGKPIGVGNAIDLYASWMFDEGNYFTEYLVDLEFIKEELERDADLELVDSDLFSNQLEIHRGFLTDAIYYESTEDTRSYLKKVAAYYEDSEINKKCMKYTNLTRYYVFRKKDNKDTDKKKSKQKGGKTKNKKRTVQREDYDFSDLNSFKLPDMRNYNDRFSMVNSVHKLMVSHSIIPKTVKPDVFLKDIGVELKQDHEIDEDYIRDIGSKIVINHEVSEKGKNQIKNIIDGLSIFVVERDCNNFYDIECTTKRKYKDTDRAVVLMKEGGLYKPIMRKESGGVRGIFRMKDDMIDYLIENGDTM